jgi:orotate phosphoribosyltransferase
MLVCQLASANNNKLNDILDFVYVRKSRKSTGTAQQLEGPQKFTSRTSESPIIHAVWVDDALSTGSSMYEGVTMLKEDYNIHVVAALYLVDRTKDRKNLDESKQYLAKEAFDNIKIFSIYDLQEIDDIIPKK